MPKQENRTVYVTHDGQEFDTYDAAQKHELKLAIRNSDREQNVGCFLQDFQLERVAAFIIANYSITEKNHVE